MKRFMVCLLAFSMIIAMPLSAFAAENNVNTFGITETVDSNNRVVRIYERKAGSIDLQQSIVPEEINYEETKELLLALGMEQDFIDKLADEDLETYSTSPQMIGTVSYVKIDAEDKVSYLSESVAIQEAEIVRKAVTEKIEELRSETGAIQPLAQDTYEDSYMRVFYLVTYLGNGKYKFSTDARWLTMPFFRGKDSIGSCAQNGTVTNSTRSGWYEYDITYINNGKITYDDGGSNISSTYFKNAINGSWYGSAAIIDLPNDVHGQYSSILYDNYKAHYEYTGHVNYPNSPSWFNTTGSYDHATIANSFTPSVSIDLDGPSGAIGLDITGSTDTRSAELEIYYNPNN